MDVSTIHQIAKGQDAVRFPFHDSSLFLTNMFFTKRQTCFLFSTASHDCFIKNIVVPLP